MTIEIGKKYKVSGSVLKKLLKEASVETLRQIELAEIILVDSDFISHVSKCENCIGNGRRFLSTPGIGEVIVGKCKNDHSC